MRHSAASALSLLCLCPPPDTEQMPSHTIDGHNAFLPLWLTANPISLDLTPDDPCKWLTTSHYRFLSAGLGRQTAVSPLKAEMLREVKFRHPNRAPFVPTWSGAEASVPRSMSSSSSSDSRGIGIAAEGESLTVSAARACTSSDRFSPA